MTINQICFLPLEESQWSFVRPFCLCPFLTHCLGGGVEMLMERASLYREVTGAWLFQAMYLSCPFLALIYLFSLSIQPALDPGSQTFYWCLNACPRTWRQTEEDKRKESPRCLFSLCPPEGLAWLQTDSSSGCLLYLVLVFDPVRSAIAQTQLFRLKGESRAHHSGLLHMAQHILISCLRLLKPSDNKLLFCYLLWSKVP